LFGLFKGFERDRNCTFATVYIFHAMALAWKIQASSVVMKVEKLTLLDLQPNCCKNKPKKKKGTKKVGKID